MRVVSLVPSWTETLIDAGVHVVGRTRFCVHPPSAKEIPVVGGTKDLDRTKLAAVKPDLILLDKEENLEWMGEVGKVHCTHVQSTEDMPQECEALARVLKNDRLAQLGQEWRSVLESPAYPKRCVAELPGVLEWLKPPNKEPEQILYMIWRGPWMAVSRDTFVGSMLSQVGFGGMIPRFEEKYPKLDLGHFDPEKTLLLFSSEPYPFAKKSKELLSLDFPSAIVDGEAYSWFGTRSLKFLQSTLN